MIQKAVQDPLAGKILAGEINDGEKVHVSEAEGELTFAPAEVSEKAA